MRSVLALLGAVALGAGGSLGAAGPAGANGDGGSRVDRVRLNHLQSIGTHNSYHLRRSRYESERVGEEPPVWAYEHRRLGEQLGPLGVRQLEIDVFADPRGGRYRWPRLRRQAGLGPLSGAMTRPGTKVLHEADLDYRTRCRTFVSCLRQVRGWSRANPGHLPVAVMVELKDKALVSGEGYVQPLRWSPSRLDDLDREIRSVFSRRELLVPDDVRRGASSLPRALRSHGWPRLGAVRGRVMFLMDNGDPQRARYLRGHPALRGRVLFTNAEPGARDAAFVKVNDVFDGGSTRIRRLVRRGYVVRTRADENTTEARSGSTTRLRRAWGSGAQWISTDYPDPRTAQDQFGTGYAGLLPGGRTVRCNPIVRGACRSGMVLDPTLEP